MQLVQCPPVDAKADEHGLTISTTGTIRLRIHAKGLDAARVVAKNWELPGLGVAVTTDATGFSIVPSGDNVDLVYPGMTTMRLEINPAL